MHTFPSHNITGTGNLVLHRAKLDLLAISLYFAASKKSTPESELG